MEFQARRVNGAGWTLTIDKPRKHASPVTDEVRKAIVWLRAKGHLMSDIAAMLGLNQGRVSEVLSGKR